MNGRILHIPFLGYIFDVGRIPRQGEQLRYKDLKLVVTRMRGMKIEEILLIKGKDEPKAGDAGPEY